MGSAKKLVLKLFVSLPEMLISSLVPLIVLRYFASVFLAIPLIVCITFSRKLRNNEGKG